MKYEKIRPVLFLLGIPALMLIVSVCLQPLDLRHMIPSQTWLTPRETFAIRQGVAGVAALVLAWCIVHFSVHRLLLRYWTAFPVMMLAVMVLAPLTIWMDCDIMILGTGWWQRTIGYIVFLLALIFTAGAAIPRFVNRERHGLLLLAGVILLSIAVPLGFLKLRGIAFVGVGALTLIFLATLPAKGLTRVLPAYFFLVLAALFLAMKLSSSMDWWIRSLSFVSKGQSHFQLQQSLVSINAGGLFGNTQYPTWIPEWHHDFMFARFCGAGGIVGGILGLLLLGIMLTVAWRIVAHQTDLRNRVVAAGCAAVLTLPPLLHIGVNLGLLPTLSIHLSFFSYGPRLIVFDGFLVGLLLSFDLTGAGAPVADRTCEASPSDVGAKVSEPPRCASFVVVGGIWIVLAIFAIRLGVLVFDSPDLREEHLASVRRYEAREEKRNKPVRGRIIDTKERVLAQTGEMFIACVDPHWFSTSEDEHLLPEFARLIEMDEDALRKCLTDTSRRYVRLKRNLLPSTAEAVRRLNLRAFFIDSVIARDYPFSTPLAHLVGCTGVEEEFHGLSGVEVAWDKELKAGHELRLTLDAELQTTVQNLAESSVEEIGAKQVQIVVMEARTGAIRAAAQVPALHGRDERPQDIRPLMWQASGQVFEPGGLLKPLIVAAALEKGVITAEHYINCEQGVWTYEGLPMRDPSPQGELTPAEILQKSSNIGMAKIGLLLGAGALHDAVAGWGMNQKCAAGLNYSESGILHATNHWSKLEITRLPIGHGCAVTLLQLLRAYTALFNEGRMVEPMLVDATRPAPDADWNPLPVAEAKSVVSPETAAWLRITLEKRIGDGLTTIGQLANVQKPFQDKTGYDPDRIITAFIGSLDIDGAPHLVAVWLDEPSRDSPPNLAVRVFVSAVQLINENKGVDEY